MPHLKLSHFARKSFMKKSIVSVVISLSAFNSFATEALVLPLVTSSFFSSANADRFELRAPFSRIAEMKKAEANFMNAKAQKFDGELVYAINGAETKVSIELSIKGFSSAVNCDFPKLELKIKKGQETIFGENKKIDLNTHCADPEVTTASDKYAFFRSMYFAHREVVAYRVLYSLGLQSFQTKPVFMKYTDSDTGTFPAAARKDEYQAFFIEDKSAFIKRHSLTELFGVNDPFRAYDIARQKTVETQYVFSSVAENSAKFDMMALAKIELLQNLIMNNDWFIRANPTDSRKSGSGELKDQLWNTKLFMDRNLNWLPIAQDFNFSMLSYAEINMPNVEMAPMTRKFIGQLSDAQLKELKELLTSKRSEILKHTELIKNDPKFERLKEFLQRRIDFLIKELSTTNPSQK